MTITQALAEYGAICARAGAVMALHLARATGRDAYVVTGEDGVSRVRVR